MGMFDYTYFKCPNCGEVVEGQSKAGDCSLSRYYFGDIAYELPVFKDCYDEIEEILPAPIEVVSEAAKFGLVCNECGHKTKPVITSSYILVPFTE